MNTAEAILRLVLAAFLGGLIGFERERHGRPAGFRTHLLVALGSALIMMVSLHLYDIFKVFHTAQYASGVDPSRIASMVVAGIGFLGAGTIIHSRGKIWGLTTAACLWVAAALGIAVGCGYYLPAIVTAIISIISLLILKQFGNIINKDWYYYIDIEMEDRSGGLEEIKAILERDDASILKVFFSKNIPQRAIAYSLSIRLRKEMDSQFIDHLGQVPGVKKIATS